MTVSRIIIPSPSLSPPLPPPPPPPPPSPPQDQYDKVCAHTDHGIEFVKRVSSFVEKRIHVEQSYAKELRRLVKQFRKKDEETSK